MLMLKPPAFQEIYNDLDEELVSLFEVLRDRKQAFELRRKVRLTPFARLEYARAYKPSADPVERARKLMIRSFMGFACKGHWQRSGFNSAEKLAWTSHSGCWATFPEMIPSFTKRLEGVILECRAAEGIIARLDTPDTLFYVDPPYLRATRYKDAAYHFEMTDADHTRLAEQLHSLKGMVLISGYPSELYDQELYADWQRVTTKSYASRAREREEVLWINPPCSERLEQERRQGKLDMASDR